MAAQRAPEPSKSRTFWYLIAGLWAVLALQGLAGRYLQSRSISYSEFKEALAAGRLEELQVSPTLVRGRMKVDPALGDKSPREFQSVRVDDEDLWRDLKQTGVKVSGIEDNDLGRELLGWLVPIALFGGLWFFVLRRLGGGGGQGFMTVGRSRAKIYVEREVKVSFDDVAGVDEAKEELREVIQFLKTPEKFSRLGGKLPKGVLLVGPPGTGKTLLAKAVAGEAAVPFFSISGSEFVEMFVGVGAARVRDLFTQAKDKAPCIIFIDELDALGKVRGVGPMSHEEREQTLNQLLVELDGFDSRSGVVLMAATNRPEILDPALLRAGRFDRHVLVDRPDKGGRLAILQVHARTVQLADAADLEMVAAMTAGLVGADLANLVNEAALLAVRRGRDQVERVDLEEAVERVIAGLEKRNRVLNRAERERVAHHEIGHALTALAIPGLDAVQKISIIPRGIAALGYTLQRPTEDRFLMTKSELEDKIAVLLGGRVAETLSFGQPSTGAQDDLLKATRIARSMIKSYGMSEHLGPLSFEAEHQPLFLEAGGADARGDYSEATAHQIDREARRIVEGQEQRVRDLLGARQPLLQAAAAALLLKETLSGDELRALVKGQGVEVGPVASQAIAG